MYEGLEMLTTSVNFRVDPREGRQSIAIFGGFEACLILSRSINLFSKMAHFGRPSVGGKLGGGSRLAPPPSMTFPVVSI